MVEHQRGGKIPYCPGCHRETSPNEEGGCEDCGGPINYVTGRQLEHLTAQPPRPAENTS